ncbi:hypothetical protein [Glaciibacter flavus]|uniref:hypothetical protein n=1 Tax=Orlajensenia flava TaxID=2565934 RepID=UPI002E27190E
MVLVDKPFSAESCDRHARRASIHELASGLGHVDGCQEQFRVALGAKAALAGLVALGRSVLNPVSLPGSRLVSMNASHDVTLVLTINIAAALQERLSTESTEVSKRTPAFSGGTERVDEIVSLGPQLVHFTLETSEGPSGLAQRLQGAGAAAPIFFESRDRVGGAPLGGSSLVAYCEGNGASFALKTLPFIGNSLIDVRSHATKFRIGARFRARLADRRCCPRATSHFLLDTTPIRHFEQCRAKCWTVSACESPPG